LTIAIYRLSCLRRRRLFKPK
jgi:Bacterial regulatory helix-turn-helix proteins, AraC family